MREREGRASGVAVTAAVIGTVASLVVALAIAAFLVLHVTGSPEQAATTFLTDWQTRLYAGMDTVTVNAPEGGVAGPLLAESRQLGMRHLELTLGQVTQDGSTAQAHFTAAVTIVTGQVWKYQGQLQLATQNRTWFVSWTPSDIFPGLQAGQRFVLDAVWGPRAPVLAADGTVLSSPRTIARSPSLQLVTGTVVRATAAEAKKLGVPYQAGDPIGQGGVEEAYQRQLAGKPAVTTRIEGPGTSRAVAHLPGGPGTQVRTSINMHDQLAASAAVRAATTTRPVDVGALQPSTGRVLAVIERPGGFDRALQGVFPPGSALHAVTRSARRHTGVRPARLCLQGGPRPRPQRRRTAPGQHRAVPGAGEHRGPGLPQLRQRASRRRQPADGVRRVLQLDLHPARHAAAERLPARVDGGHVRLQLPAQPGHPGHARAVHHAPHAGGPGRRRLRPGNRPGQPAQRGIYGGGGGRKG